MVNIKTLVKEYGKFITLIILVLWGPKTLDFSREDNKVEQITFCKNNTEIFCENVKSSTSECEEKSFWDNLQEWEMPGLKVDVENKKMCGISKKTYYTDASLITSVPITLTSYSFSYKVEYKEGRIAPYLVRLGNEFIDVYLHEENPQLIGISTLKSEEGKLVFSREKNH